MSRKDKIPEPPVDRGPNQNRFTWKEIEKKCFYRRDLAKEYIFDDNGKVIRRKNWPKPKLQEV